MTVQDLANIFACSKATGNTRLVLLAIANHHGEKGAWPSVDRLAKEANVSRRTVQRAIADAVALEELDVFDNEGPAGTNVYRLKVGGRQSDTRVKPGPGLTPNTNEAFGSSSSLSSDSLGAESKSASAPSESHPNGNGLAEALLASESTAQYLLDRLDDRWSEVLSHAALMKLGKRYGATVVTDALRNMREEQTVPKNPYPYFERVCARLADV